MNVIAIIPARGNSKRIPNKNLREFIGKPMIGYSIETAMNSNIFDKVIVSTDSVDIAETSLKFGAEVNEKRPENLSDDFATIRDVMKYECEKIPNLDSNTIAMCLLPTNPFLTDARIKEGLSLILEGNFSYVFSAVKFNHPIQRGFVKKDRGIELVSPDFIAMRTQDLPETFHDAGQFYFSKVSNWMNKNEIFNSNSQFIELNKFESIDIDNIEDWEFAEKLFIAHRKK